MPAPWKISAFNHNDEKTAPLIKEKPFFFGMWLPSLSPMRSIPISRRDRPPPHLYQLIHYRDRFAVPPSFREAIAKHAIPKAPHRKPSRTARKSISQPTSILQPTLQAGACRATTKTIERLGQLYPARLLFFRRLFASSLLTKSRSPHAVGTGVANASKATHDAVGPKLLEKRVTSVRVGAYQI